ncbi:hypothetical protein [Insolitispirillum peregrinum]|uniref:Uncharacterized protein n=1 Tax=Insolitispirillum peregrinum TaxID=80876 RepID=A0A1N7LGM3_9PROT|nr:hypothetical protein [Insolitispirillum peregrinum]SIS72911.1 hypothetical protein SAMN05421779_103314 [Insolitispirillum peregrinum]
MRPIRIVAAQDYHLRDLARRLRAGDRAEVAALGYPDPLPGIRASAAASLWVKAGVIDTRRGERVLAVWGLGAVAGEPDVGGPWLLSTRSIERYRSALLRYAKAEIPAMHQRFPILRGVVDARYAGAVRWIGWMGFQYGPPMEINGVPFLPFERRV